MERRFTMQTEGLEVRDHSEEHPGTLRGYGAVFYRADTPGTEFELFENVAERIMPGAFDRALHEADDVRGVFNHDPSLILGRSTAGTMRLSLNRRGLQYEIDLPNTQVGRDVAESVRRGDVTGSSFAFKVTDESWRTVDSQDIREIRGVELFDVGPVTFPAYKATSTGLRDEFVAECRSSREQWTNELRKVDEADAEAVAVELEEYERKLRILQA